jgi:hypothetical protein
MKRALCLTMFLAGSSSIHAQTAVAPAGAAQAGTAPTGIAGTWRFEAEQDSWTATLKAEGSKLTGTVTSCASNRVAIDIFEGQVDGNAITFKCKSLNGVRTLTFTGKVSGDEIAVTWEQAGAGGNGADAFIFGESAPRQFTLKRVNAVTWTGTTQRIRGEGVVDTAKAPASIEIKRGADPHWRWRDVGELTVVTFVAGGNRGGTFQVSNFLATDQKLSYSFHRYAENEPTSKDDLVGCAMTKRADGAFEGECSGGGFAQHVILNPPAPAAAK